MKPFEEVHEWRSLHTQYLWFAVRSVRASRRKGRGLDAATAMLRHKIESIRYSYDCLEASMWFVFHQACSEQLPTKVAGNWLLRHLKRKASEVSLADFIGMLTFGWTGQSFWLGKTQFQLFEDLRKVRNGFTHPQPFGTKARSMVISEEPIDGGLVRRMSRQVGADDELRPDWLIHRKKAVAKFAPNPDKLKYSDAEQALEILLRHLLRIQEVFFGHEDSSFAYWDEGNTRAVPTSELLDTIKCRFAEVWPYPSANGSGDEG